MKQKKQCLHTARLCLKAFSPQDGVAMGAILTHPEVGKTYMVPDFPSQEAVAALFERFRQLSLGEDRLVYGIYREGRLIGFANEVSRENGAMELGYVIHPDHQNRGYATEALAALICEILSMGFRTVRAGAFEENPASLRVMKKCGMTPTGETEEIFYRGKNRRCVYYAITRHR